jgi:hypothetical protein
MVAQVLEVRLDGGRAGDNNPGHDLTLIVRCGFPFPENDGVLGTMPQACAQAVAQELADYPGLPVNNLQGALGAIRQTVAAAVALGLVNFYYFAQHNRIRTCLKISSSIIEIYFGADPKTCPSIAEILDRILDPGQGCGNLMDWMSDLKEWILAVCRRLAVGIMFTFD